MAALTPAVKGDANYLSPNSLIGGVQEVGANDLVDLGNVHIGQGSSRWTCWYFATIANNDTWDNPPPYPKSVWWKGDRESSDACNPNIIVGGQNPQISFTVAAGTVTGWVLVESAT